MSRPDHAADRHATVHGSPGTRLRLMGLAKSLWPLVLVLVAAGYLVRAALPVPAIPTAVCGLLFLALAVAVAAAANHSRERLGNFLKGARGEESVARALALLPGDYHVFHGIAATGGRGRFQGGADLDHVVVGPGGVLVVETKNWSGTLAVEDGRLLCDGERPDTDPLVQVRTAAAALHDRLRRCRPDAPPVPVWPVLCFNGNRLPERLDALGGIALCNEQSLAGVIIRITTAHPLAMKDWQEGVIRELEAGLEY